MAQRRMFSRRITESDAFTEMTSDAQSLYFHLGMNADDEGFVTPRGIMRLINAPEDALRTLIAKGFAIPFETGGGVIVVTHWKENNYIPKDRFTPTIYRNEKNELLQDPEGFYVHRDAYNPHGDDNDLISLEPRKDNAKESRIQPVYKSSTQVRLGKVRLGKVTNTHTSPDDGFGEVWDIYPRKVGKQQAIKAYRRVASERQAIIDGIRRYQTSPQWTKDGGNFIPHLATFLNNRRWEDEFDTVKATRILDLTK